MRLTGFVLVCAAAALPLRRAHAQSTYIDDTFCPRVTDQVPTRGLYSNVASPGTQPASCFFCGNLRKYLGNGAVNTTISGGAVDYDPVTLRARCKNNQQATLYQPLATERAEIRGWVVTDEGFNGEDEYTLQVLVDLGWSTRASGVYPVNTLENLIPYITPANILAFGVAQGATPPPYSAPFGPKASALLSSLHRSSTAGGAYAPVIHLEIDGWGQSFVKDGYPPDSCWNSGLADPSLRCESRGFCDLSAGSCFPTWYDVNAPHGWAKNNDNGTPAYWPFPLLNPDGSHMFKEGTYVRAVGTLWKDWDHPENPSISCWEGDSTQYLGWQEMHPVDYMEVIAPADRNVPTNHTVAGYELCAPGGFDEAFHNVQIHSSFSIGPRPAPGYEPYVFERSYGPVINWGSLDSPYNAASQSARVGIAGPDASGNYSVRFDVSATSDLNRRALFNSFYDAYWCAPTCPSNQCGGQLDGCGGTCPVVSCPTNAACSGGTCFCQGGTSMCSGTCVNLASDNNNCGQCGAFCETSCSGGACQPPACPSGYKWCGGNVCVKGLQECP